MINGMIKIKTPTQSHFLRLSPLLIESSSVYCTEKLAFFDVRYVHFLLSLEI